MKKWILCVLSMLVFTLQSCHEQDDLWDAIGGLKDRVTELETNLVPKVNEDIASLHKLLNQTTVIVGTSPIDGGYVLELSDGTKMEIVLGADANAPVPILGIDSEGYWIYSLDNGKHFYQLSFNNELVSAYPKNQEGEHGYGKTPELRVNEEGYWEISLGDDEWTPMMQEGKKVSALGQEFPYSGFFEKVAYEESTKMLSLELKDGQKLTFHVEDSFGVSITAKEEEVFFLGETRQFEVAQYATKEAMIQCSEGWTASLEEKILVVNAPSNFKEENAQGEVKVIVTSKENYLKTATLRMKLLNKKPDENLCQAWRDYLSGSDKNVLLDYSYAGYKHGEEAPQDALGMGYKIYNVCDYGADATGATSSREALMKIIRELKLDKGVEKANAVIYFPEGRFVLHNDDDNVLDSSSGNQQFKDSKGNNRSLAIFMHGGHFVVKGAGRDKTFLEMQTPNLPDNARELWSSPTLFNIKHNSSHSTVITSVTGDAQKGDFSVEIGATTSLKAGDWVCLYLKNNDPALVAQELAPHRVEGNMQDIKTVLVEDFHQVKSVSGGKLTFVEPIMHAVEAKWNWEIRKYPHYEEVGIEDLTFVGHAKTNFIHHASWHDDGAFKPLQMMRLTNSWIRRVDFQDISEAAILSFSANCSAYDIEIKGVRGHSGVRSASSSRIFMGKIRETGRGLVADKSPMEGQMQDNVGQYHASGVSNTALGTVLWNNTWGNDSFFESHSKQPRATLVDRCKGGFTESRFGGADTNVPNHLDDMTIWNFEATRVTIAAGNDPFKWWKSTDLWWKNLPPTIIGMHGEGPVNFDPRPEQIKYLESNGQAVEPLSLYEAQLIERLGAVPAWLNSLK